jgi:hypothetical protein
MASANRSSYINLYASEDKSDDAYKCELECKQADVKWEGAQDLTMDFATYQFTKSDDTTFDLESRFNTLESDSTAPNNSVAISQLQSDLAAESNARQSADTANANATSAEVDARVSAVAAVQAEVDAEEVRADAAEVVNADAIAAESSSRATADSSEQQRAEAAEVALGTRIDNVLSNADGAALDSLSELLAAYTAADSSLGDSIVSAISRIATLESQVAELTQSS